MGTFANRRLVCGHFFVGTFFAVLFPACYTEVTTPQKAQTSDPFWDRAETAFLSALILYLYHEAPESERNFATVMYMVENSAVREEDENYCSPVDLLFDDLERVDPDHIALKEYKVFKQASGKTAKSILVSTAVRLAAFNLPEMARLTSRDDMQLGTLGDRKRVIFAVIPDNDASFNYLVGILYGQAFQELYYAADNQYGGRLPIPVRVLMDEFANVALPEDFERILSTCRSREISINIVIQNMAQLKKLFKDSWENVTGNCDTLLYLGGNEASTHEYISKALGKETIDTRTRGITRGRSGSSNVNYQNAGRELLMPDEVRMLDTESEIHTARSAAETCFTDYLPSYNAETEKRAPKPAVSESGHILQNHADWSGDTAGLTEPAGTAAHPGACGTGEYQKTCADCKKYGSKNRKGQTGRASCRKSYCAGSSRAVGRCRSVDRAGSGHWRRGSSYWHPLWRVLVRQR
ncbi:VirD4-like conjugal transfer protein, CD1115 family [Ruthenibacterium lactatiformans]|uniref:VirD4-like conjugal transfer protein, CD1115 family n=1 Tax=Ruthenibacterium lactatiformans TaxID=1550024 RepID=UPI00266C9AFC|nr:type IV secretory system conjugative DNA transfer family protein [Ruthenibacterium lactatiformans]